MNISITTIVTSCKGRAQKLFCRELSSFLKHARLPYKFLIRTNKQEHITGFGLKFLVLPDRTVHQIHIGRFLVQQTAESAVGVERGEWREVLIYTPSPS